MRITRYRSTFIVVLMLLAGMVKAQTCGTCSVTVSSLSSAAYTVNNGQTLCLDSTAKYTGNITLNGGTLCNKGMFKPDTFLFVSGSLVNYGTVVISGSLSVGSGKSIYSEKKSFVRINGDFALSGGNLTNKGIVNIKNNINYSTGTFNNSGIINCRVLSGATTSITNTGIINKD